MTQAFDRGFSEVAALFQASRLNEAQAAAAALIAAHPEVAAGHNILGVIQATRGDAAAAAASFRKAGSLDARWDEPHTNLGLLLCQQKDFAAATECFRAALVLKPASAAALNLGNALRELGRRDEAVATYREVLARGGPEQALAHNNIGAILLDQGNAEDAAASFAQAIRLQPGLADAHLNLGRALRQLGRREEALGNLRKAAELAPRSAEAAVVLANTLADLGQLADAAEAYRCALTLKPGDREAAYNLGLALNALGRHGEGLKAIANGPGIARLSTGAPGNAGARRLAVAGGTTFIGAWSLQDPSLCDALIGYFENNRATQTPGRTGLGVDTAVKDSTDLAVMPADLGKPELAAAAAYLKELEACVGDYAVQWPHFGGMLGQVDVVPFTIQRYTPGGHFQKPHAERMAFGFIHRVLAWMTYLNDVPEGGATTFHHYGIQVKPERGKTLIWPAEWTHVHAGEVVPAGIKYIITGWMHFPGPV